MVISRPGIIIVNDDSVHNTSSHMNNCPRDEIAPDYLSLRLTVARLIVARWSVATPLQHHPPPFNAGTAVKITDHTFSATHTIVASMRTVVKSRSYGRSGRTVGIR